MAERILVRKIEENLWQWREVTAQGEWRSNAFYTGDINLLKESIEGKTVWLIFSGLDIVSERVAVDIKDRRQLLKILPFEVEEHIIDPVEEMQFCFGEVEGDSIALAYGEVEVLMAQIQEITAINADVQRCLVDYLMLPFQADSWTLLLENNLLYVRTERMLGFCVEVEAADLFLKALSAKAKPKSLNLYGDTDENLQKLQSLLPDDLENNPEAEDEEENAEMEAVAEEAGFWDLVEPSALPVLDFRTGRLARKLPFAKWWAEWKVPTIAAAAAFVVAMGATWFGQVQADKMRKTIISQTDEIFRQAVPNGPITDPVRQLRGLLGSSGEVGVGSNATALLVGVAPSVASFSQVKIRNLRYSSDNAQLQLDIEADSFTTFESLRSKIAEQGFEVEIKSANVYGDTHQAQLRISEAS